MSNNDLIRRRDAEEARDELARVLNYINTSGAIDYADYCELFDTIERVFDALKSVPHEMTAREYERALDRAFRSDDDAYGEWADAIDEGNKDKAVAIIENWAKEHPEERSEE